MCNLDYLCFVPRAGYFSSVVNKDIVELLQTTLIA